MSLQVICRRCSAETPATACDATGLCVICITSDAVAALKAEYLRLWKKRARYLAKGVNCGPVEEQLAGVARRLGDQVHARISNMELAISILNAHLEEARNMAEYGYGSRLVIPKPGGMLAALRS